MTIVTRSNSDDFNSFLEEKNKIRELENLAQAKLREASNAPSENQREELKSEYEELSRLASLRRQYLRGKYGL